jgi:hypothetical protein
MSNLKKAKIVVKKVKPAKKRTAVTKIVVHNPDPVVEVTVHDPNFLERTVAWVKETFS